MVRSTSKSAVTDRRRTKFILACVLASVSASPGCGESFSEGREIEVTISPSSIIFPSVETGSTESRSATITHTGRSGVLELEPARLEAAGSDMRVEGPTPANLAPGESATVTLIYAPSDGVNDAGLIRIAHNMDERDDLVIPVDTALQEPRLTAQPLRIEFGAQSVGTRQQRTVRIVNDGWLEDTILAIGLDSAQGPLYTIVDPPTMPLTLAIGAEFDLTIEYAPPITGSDAEHVANLRFVTESPATLNRIVPVSGAGRHDMLQHKPALANFGWVTVDSSQTTDIVLSNTGAEPVEVHGVTLELDPSVTGLSVIGIPEVPFVLSPSETLTLTLRFAPSAPISLPAGQLGTMTIASDDYLVSEREIPIVGHAGVPSIIFKPSDVSDFGVVAVLHEHVRRVRAINNGPVPLTITGANLASDSAEGFALRATPAEGLSLAPGGSAEFELGYLNGGLNDGVSWGQLVVESDDPVSPTAALNLRARNAASPECIPRLTPPLLNFGTLSTGGSVELELLLVNDGSLPCVFKSVAFLDCTLPFGLCQPTAGLSKVFGSGFPKPVTGQQLFFGESIEIPVVYTPIQAVAEDGGIPVVTIENGVGSGSFRQHYSPSGGMLPVLSGIVGTAGVIARPTELEFELTSLGCGSAPMIVDVFRLGSQPISLAEIDMSACTGAFKVTSAPGLPIALHQQASETGVPIEIKYSPGVSGPAQCEVTLRPDVATSGSATVMLTGTGALSPDRLETFTQAQKLAVDILFVVDSSGSMGDEQSALVAGFGGFIEQAKAWDVAYQVGVVTTDL
ncbi:MAG: hypothetical protein ACI9OJ_005983, partial [Myxococcota bacterium]